MKKKEAPAPSRIEIKGFRRLHDVTVDMRPLMVLIGANGVGKTSFLDAVSLLSASAAGALNGRLSDLGGVVDVLTRGYSGDMVLNVEVPVPHFEPLRYELHLETQGQAYGISQETLSQASGEFLEPFKHIDSQYSDVRYFETETRKLLRPNWEHDPFESSLSQVPRMYRQAEEFRRTLSSAAQYHVLDVSKRAPVKLPQLLKPAELPGDNGEDLVPFLYNLREADPDRYQAIEDSLKAAFPSFESLNFPSPAAGMLSMTWKDANFRTPMYTHQLSEGTLRFLWLIALLQSPGLPVVAMIDEPEVSLHPELLSLLADLLREASGRSQIIVATHSDRFVRFLDPQELVVMDADSSGHASMTWADSLDLDEWLAEYSLDEVWRLGRIGGRS